ncbi:MAG: multiprotein-bridging factor 1 family protein [Saprospiraceae bacterium]
MQKFVLTVVFILLLGLLIQDPYPILDHEYLLTEYQMIPVGTQIKKARLKKKVSFQSLAKLIERTPAEIKKMEAGLLVPDSKLLAKIQVALNCKISLTEKPAPIPSS